MGQVASPKTHHPSQTFSHEFKLTKCPAGTSNWTNVLNYHDIWNLYNILSPDQFRHSQVMEQIFWKLFSLYSLVISNGFPDPSTF